jgi:hypothetical protein
MVHWGIALGILVLVLNIIMSAYATNLNEQIAAANGQLRTQEDRRDKDAEEQLKSAQKQSKLMNQLLRNHVYWSEAFDLIEGLMQSNILLTNLSAQVADGTIAFSARGPNYAAVARQVASFNVGDGITDVELGQVKAIPEGGVEFGGDITINVNEVVKRSAVPAASSGPATQRTVN